MYFVFQSDPKSGILDLEVINAGKEDISGISQSAYLELYVKNRLTSVGADKKQILKTAFV